MSLNRRCTLEIELPEFLLRSLLRRVEESNVDAELHEQIELNDVIEWYLAAPITVGDVPKLEAAIPGFADALGAWLASVNYEL